MQQIICCMMHDILKFYKLQKLRTVFLLFKVYLIWSVIFVFSNALYTTV